jgi:ribosomal protein L35
MPRVIPMSLLCPSKNKVAFKITKFVIDENFKSHIIFKWTQKDMRMTFEITRKSAFE